MPVERRLATISEVYDTALERLARRRDRLAVHSKETGHNLDTADTDPPQPPPIYETGFGTFTFEQLYETTRPIVAFVMRQSLGMYDAEDIDDCLQAGYLKVWKQLQTDPQRYADKPKRYVVQAVVLNAKSQRYAHLRHFKKIDFKRPSPEQREYPSLTTHNVDTWLDIAAALENIFPDIEDDVTALTALYTLLTQAKVGEAAMLFEVSPKSVYKRRRQLKEQLATELQDYRPKSHRNGSNQPPRGGLPAISVVDTLLSTIHQDEAVRHARALASDRELLREAQSRRKIQQRIRPFEPEPQQYLTRWRRELTLDDILSDPQVRRGAYAKLNDLGISSDFQDDCFQQGSLKLWQTLEATPDLLQDKGPVWVGIFIAYSGNPKKQFRYQQRQRRFDNLDFDWESADEHLKLGEIKDNDWRDLIDNEIDLSIMMGKLADQYRDDYRALLALYALTTSVRIADLSGLLRLHPKNFAATIGNKVRDDIAALAIDRSI